MNKTQMDIFEAANKCFFQYGYSKTSLKMVSELSGLSRVTIYKHFKDKENLFREVMAAHMEQLVAKADESLQHESLYWRKLELLIESWIVSPLESIASDMVINDLKHAAKQIGENFIDKWHNVLQGKLDAITAQAAEEGQIDPAKLDMSLEQVSRVVGMMIRGLANHNVSELRQGVDDMNLFLKAALKP